MKLFKTALSTISLLLLLLMLWSMPALAQTFDTDALNGYAQPPRPIYTIESVNSGNLATDISEKAMF